ncbi:hypothetical protein KBB27_01775 [Patescibacteria group bacterium]|nr:hypothetical protein [Patescibacteria group bacterium]
MSIDQEILKSVIGQDEQAERIAKHVWDHATAGFRIDLLIDFFGAMHGGITSLHDKEAFLRRIFQTTTWEEAAANEAKNDPEAAMNTVIETAPQRIASVFLDSGAKTLAEFATSTSEDKLLKRRGFAETSLVALREILERHGLKLRKH